MPKPQKRKGIFSRFITRAVAAPLLIAAVFLPQLAFAAPSASFSGINSTDSAKSFFHISGDNLPSNQYQAVPQSVSGPDAVKPNQLAVVICAQTGSDGTGQCTQSSSDAHVFKFTRMHHEDLGGGADYWDYSFVAAGNDTLQFLYRKNPGQGSHWGLIYGETDQSADFSQNKVAGLHDFGPNTDLARNVLEPQANDAGLAWAKAGGIDTSTNQSGFLDRSSGNDPFMLAVQKATEAVNSLSEAVSNAVLWAIKTANPTQVHGLADAWQAIRDLVNVLFIVILVAMSILTIMRIDQNKYSVRSLLPMLIFAVILVNFSFVIATVMSNTAYVLSQPFLSSAVDLIGRASQVGSASAPADFGSAIVILLASVIMLIALGFLLIFFIVRIIMIWLLAAMSPIVCLAMVLPLTRGEGSKIMTQGIRWVYMAPIALIILFVGSQVAIPSPGQDQSTDSLLVALFYAGLVAAAVMIPIGLGGGVMRAVANRSTGAAKAGGKGGLGLAGSIPLGRGMTVGELTRTGRGYTKLRKDAQEQRGLERAAGWQSAIHDSIGNRGIATSLTGRDATQAATVTEGLVDERMKRLDSIGFKDPDYLQVKDYIMAPEHQRAQLAQSMSADQLEQGRSRVGQLATMKALATNGWWDDDIARRFGHTGYQKFAESDPAMRSLKRKHYGANHQFGMDDFDTTGFSLTMASIDGDGLRKIQTPFWDYMNPNSAASQAMPGASQMVRQMVSDDGIGGRKFNYNALRQNLNARHRNNAPDAKRARHVGNWDHIQTPEFSKARRAILSGIVDSREDRFMPVGSPGAGPQTFTAAETEIHNMAPPKYVRDG